MNVVVSAKDFMQHLEENNLVIVHKDQLKLDQRIAEEKLKRIHSRLLKQDAVSIGDAVKFKLLHIATYQGIKSSPLFRKGEVYKTASGDHMIVTSAIKRIRKQKHLD